MRYGINIIIIIIEPALASYTIRWRFLLNNRGITVNVTAITLTAIRERGRFILLAGLYSCLRDRCFFLFFFLVLRIVTKTIRFNNYYNTKY